MADNVTVRVVNQVVAVVKMPGAVGPSGTGGGGSFDSDKIFIVDPQDYVSMATVDTTSITADTGNSVDGETVRNRFAQINVDMAALYAVRGLA